MSWFGGGGEGPACLVCGGRRYAYTRVLWQGLIDEWGLSPDEGERIDRQQGVRCLGCGCNLRSVALGGGVCDAVGFDGRFDDWLGTSPGLRVLEINPAGDLTRRLGRLAGLERVAYPRVDMRSLPHESGTFDLVIHSDTLEHVGEPGRALAECRRVLRAGGWLAMTVPTVPGRLTRSREGLPASYHGGEGEERDDHLVHTEFGADAWAVLLAAGFERVGIRAFGDGCGLCWTARK